MADRAVTDDDCKDAGKVVPVVDRNRCEAKGPCVDVCPFDVFEIRPIGEAEKAGMTFVGRLKAWAHGNRQAFVVKPADCHNCGRCVVACPEHAIRLVPA